VTHIGNSLRERSSKGAVEGLGSERCDPRIVDSAAFDNDAVKAYPITLPPPSLGGTPRTCLQISSGSLR
jgi:hypothetical protein